MLPSIDGKSSLINLTTESTFKPTMARAIRSNLSLLLMPFMETNTLQEASSSHTTSDFPALIILNTSTTQDTGLPTA